MVVVVFLSLYAVWYTFERAGFLVTMASLAQMNAAQRGSPAQALGTGLSLTNLLSTLFSILAWWAVAVLAWLVRSEKTP